jgi:hypothetical protein
MANDTYLNFGRDVQGFNAYAPAPSTNKWSVTLVNGDATSITVPSNYQTWIVSFRYYPNNVWIDVSGNTAAIPAGNTLASTTSEMNPATLTLQKGTVISMITDLTTADVSVVMWPVSYS